MNGRRRRALEKEFRRIHGTAPPRTFHGEDEGGQFTVKSMARAIKKRPREFGIGVSNQTVNGRVLLGSAMTTIEAALSGRAAVEEAQRRRQSLPSKEPKPCPAEPETNEQPEPPACPPLP